MYSTNTVLVRGGNFATGFGDALNATQQGNGGALLQLGVRQHWRRGSVCARKCEHQAGARKRVRRRR